MKLYVSHSTAFDYASELYEPLKAAFGDRHELVLPHEAGVEGVDAKSIIPTCEFVLAEVSYPSTGQGIELGWADMAGTPIICFHRSAHKASGALRFINVSMFAYQDSGQLIRELEEALS